MFNATLNDTLADVNSSSVPSGLKNDRETGFAGHVLGVGLWNLPVLPEWTALVPREHLTAKKTREEAQFVQAVACDDRAVATRPCWRPFKNRKTIPEAREGNDARLRSLYLKRWLDFVYINMEVSEVGRQLLAADVSRH